MKSVLTAALLLPLLASANDGIGAVSAGGIVFGKTDAIAMKKEVLNVSYTLISVDYEFVNESAAEVEETIIFPLPAYPASNLPSESYYGQPGGFSIKVDDKPVSFRTVVQASLNGKDVTAQLKKAGLSDAQIAYTPAFGEQRKVAKLTAQQRQQLIQLHLIGDGPTAEIEPIWDIQVNYVWQQKFPANKVVRVHHEYKPFISGGPGDWVMDKDTEKRFCTDAAFLASWKKFATHDPYSDVLPSSKVAYILKTGNTWKNGIEDFTLNVIKNDPKELVSLCFPGSFKKIDARTYQVKLRNFRPTNDLDVYFGNITPGETVSEGEMPLVK